MIRFIIKILGKILPMRGYKEGDKIRADVFLEIWILWTGIIFFFGSIGLSFYAVYIHEYLYFVLVALAFVMSIYAFLSWKNNKINLVGSDKFEHTNFLGKKRVFAFKDLDKYRVRDGNITLYFGKEKVFIDKASYMSERFSALLKPAMNGMYAQMPKESDNIFPDKSPDKEETRDLSYYYDKILKKCDYGNNDDVLNEHERRFMIAMFVDGEVNDGGFNSFFTNSSGKYANEIVEVFRVIGSDLLADVCEKAVSIFDGPVPTDWDERIEAYEKLDEAKVREVFDDCDELFYESEEDFEDLCMEYIQNHLDSFEC